MNYKNITDLSMTPTL